MGGGAFIVTLAALLISIGVWCLLIIQNVARKSRNHAETGVTNPYVSSLFHQPSPNDTGAQQHGSR